MHQILIQCLDYHFIAVKFLLLKENGFIHRNLNIYYSNLYIYIYKLDNNYFDNFSMLSIYQNILKHF